MNYKEAYEAGYRWVARGLIGGEAVFRNKPTLDTSNIWVPDNVDNDEWRFIESGWLVEGVRCIPLTKQLAYSKPKKNGTTKAMQPRAPKVANCQWCGAEFIRKNDVKKFCSYRCYVAYRHDEAAKKAALEEAAEERSCKGCGRKFVVKKNNKKQKYCSRECQIKTNRKAVEARRRAKRIADEK